MASSPAPVLPQRQRSSLHRPHLPMVDLPPRVWQRRTARHDVVLPPSPSPAPVACGSYRRRRSYTMMWRSFHHLPLLRWRGASVGGGGAPRRRWELPHLPSPSSLVGRPCLHLLPVLAALTIEGGDHAAARSGKGSFDVGEEAQAQQWSDLVAMASRGGRRSSQLNDMCTHGAVTTRMDGAAPQNHQGVKIERF
jgi:hypothetical protein